MWSTCFKSNLSMYAIQKTLILTKPISRLFTQAFVNLPSVVFTQAFVNLPLLCTIPISNLNCCTCSIDCYDNDTPLQLLDTNNDSTRNHLHKCYCLE